MRKFVKVTFSCQKRRLKRCDDSDIETSCDLRRQLAWHGGVSVACLYARDCLFSPIRGGYGAVNIFFPRLVLGNVEGQAGETIPTGPTSLCQRGGP